MEIIEAESRGKTPPHYCSISECALPRETVKETYLKISIFIHLINLMRLYKLNYQLIIHTEKIRRNGNQDIMNKR